MVMATRFGSPVARRRAARRLSGIAALRQGHLPSHHWCAMARRGACRTCARGVDHACTAAGPLTKNRPRFGASPAAVGHISHAIHSQLLCMASATTNMSVLRARENAWCAMRKRRQRRSATTAKGSPATTAMTARLKTMFALCAVWACGLRPRSHGVKSLKKWLRKRSPRRTPRRKRSCVWLLQRR